MARAQNGYEVSLGWAGPVAGDLAEITRSGFALDFRLPLRATSRELSSVGVGYEFLTFDVSSGSGVLLRSTSANGGVAELRRHVTVVN